MFFWNSLAFLMIQWMLAIWSLVLLPFLKPAWTSGSSRFTYCLSQSPFHYRGLECKSRSQETPEVMGKFGLGVWNEAGQRLIEFCQENTLVIANTLFRQHKRRLYTWTSTDGKHQNQIDYSLCSQRWRNSMKSEKKEKEKTRSWLWLRSWTPYCLIQT